MLGFFNIMEYETADPANLFSIDYFMKKSVVFNEINYMS